MPKSTMENTIRFTIREFIDYYEYEPGLLVAPIPQNCTACTFKKLWGFCLPTSKQAFYLKHKLHCMGTVALIMDNVYVSCMKRIVPSILTHFMI